MTHPRGPYREVMAVWTRVRVLVSSALVVGLVGAVTPAFGVTPSDPGLEFGLSHRPVCPPTAPAAPRCHAQVVTDAVGRPLATTAYTNGYAPADLANAYALPLGGAGQTVAIVDAYDNPSAESDLATYRSTFGLPPCTTAN